MRSPRSARSMRSSVTPARSLGAWAHWVGAGLGALLIGVALAQNAPAPSDVEADLAKKLANPVAALISVPIQYNYDQNLGPTDNGSKSYLNIQPVIPVDLNADWNLITRTIVPFIDLRNVPVNGRSESGTD
jgi:hypothetical protein